MSTGILRPRSIRLVVYLPGNYLPWPWQYTELHYRRGHPIITGAHHGDLVPAGLDPHLWSDRAEALLAAARQVRSA